MNLSSFFTCLLIKFTLLSNFARFALTGISTVSERNSRKHLGNDFHDTKLPKESNCAYAAKKTLSHRQLLT